MPSSPSTPSTRQAAAYSEKLNDQYPYRQTMYHNGAGLHIEEARRQPGVARKVESSTRAYEDFILYPTNDAMLSTRRRTVESSQNDPASRSRPAEFSSMSHVTFAKSVSKGRPKPVIIHNVSKSMEDRLNKKPPSYRPSSDPTPPPTPRLARLATPDLSDVEDAPFCDCGANAHVVRRCTSCGKEDSLR